MGIHEHYRRPGYWADEVKREAAKSRHQVRVGSGSAAKVESVCDRLVGGTSWSKKKGWTGLRFGEKEVATAGARHELDVLEYFADLEPATVRVELYAEGVGESALEIQ